MSAASVVSEMSTSDKSGASPRALASATRAPAHRTSAAATASTSLEPEPRCRQPGAHQPLQEPIEPAHLIAGAFVELVDAGKLGRRRQAGVHEYAALHGGGDWLLAQPAAIVSLRSHCEPVLDAARLVGLEERFLGARQSLR